MRTQLLPLLALLMAACGSKSVIPAAHAAGLSSGPVYEFHVEDYQQPGDADFGPAFQRMLADPSGCGFAPTSVGPYQFTAAGCRVRLACNTIYDVTSLRGPIAPAAGHLLAISGCGASSQIRVPRGTTPALLVPARAAMEIDHLLVLMTAGTGIATGTQAVDAVEVHGAFHADSVWIRGATRRNVWISADASQGTIADDWGLTRSSFDLANGEGIRIEGGDSNVGFAANNSVTSNCQAPVGACAGIDDESFLGCTWAANHTESNGPAGHVSAGIIFGGGSQRSLGLGNYSESNQPQSSVSQSSLMIGGLMASTAGEGVTGPGGYFGPGSPGVGIPTDTRFRSPQLEVDFDGANGSGLGMEWRSLLDSATYGWGRAFQPAGTFLGGWYTDRYANSPSAIGLAYGGFSQSRGLGAVWAGPTAPFLVGAAAVRVGSGTAPPAPGGNAWPPGSLWIYSAPSSGSPALGMVVCAGGSCAWRTIASAP